MFPQVETHACHGDLHCSNILFEAGSNHALCAIDFGHCNFDHHFLKDYVALEADLVFGVLSPDSWGFRQQLEMFRDALKILHSTFDVHLSIFESSPTGIKALATWTKRIRDAAWVDMEQDPRHIPEYFIGLCRHAISRCGQSDNRLTPSQRWIAGHAANNLGYISNRSERWSTFHFDLTATTPLHHQIQPKEQNAARNDTIPNRF